MYQVPSSGDSGSKRVSGSALYVELLKLVFPITLSVFLISVPIFDIAPAVLLAIGHTVVVVLRAAAMFSQSRYDHPSYPLLLGQGLVLVFAQGLDFPSVISAVFSTLVFFKTDRLVWLSTSAPQNSAFEVLANQGAVAVTSGLITGGLLTFSLAPTVLHVAVQISVLLVRTLLLRRWASREDLGASDVVFSLVSSYMRPGAPLAVWLGLVLAISKSQEISSIPALQPDTPSDFRVLLVKVPVREQISRVGCLCELATRNFQVDTARAQSAATRELRILADRLGERKLRELAPDPEKLSKILSY